MHIQVESTTDMGTVIGILNDHMRKQLESSILDADGGVQKEVCLEELNNDIIDLMSRLAPNIHVNGVSWDNTEGIFGNNNENQKQLEPINDALVQELSRYHQGFESLLSTLVRYRTNAPGQIDRNLKQKHFDVLQEYMNDGAVSKDENISEQMPTDASGIIYDPKDLEGLNLPDLESIRKNILDPLKNVIHDAPVYKAKLERALSILEEEEEKCRKYQNENKNIMNSEYNGLGTKGFGLNDKSFNIESPLWSEEERKQYLSSKKLYISQSILEKLRSRV